MEGILKMLDYLDIAGSTSTYNIYTAIQREQDIAKKPDLKVFVYNSDKYSLLEAVCRDYLAKGDKNMDDEKIDKVTKLIGNLQSMFAKY